MHTRIEGPSAATGIPSLRIDDRAGSQWLIVPGQSFLIGRTGDLSFDDNPYLHRRLLHLGFHDGFWWITNVGRRIPVRLRDERTGAPAVLPSGASTIVASDDVLLVFEAGPTVYEVAVGLTAAPSPPSPLPSAADRETGRSFTAGPGNLNVEQLQLLVAMAEPQLRYPGTGLDRIPSIQAVAARLGWSVTKVNRKLDYLCERLADGGVSGLVSDGRGQAVNRRMRLVEYALYSRMITPESLVLLDGQHPEPRG